MTKASHPLLIFLLLATPAVGQEAGVPDGSAAAAVSEEVDDTETIVVTASRTEQRRFEAPRSIEVLGGDEREEAVAPSLPELVERSVGALLQQTNRGAGAPIIRGLVGPQNLVLLDGVRFNTATWRTGPLQYLALVDPFLLGQFEIIRGPSSVLYGDGAMGGVMQVLTPAPRFSPGGFGFAGRGRLGVGGVDGSGVGSLELTAAGGDWAAVAGASLEHFGELRAGGGALVPASGFEAQYWNLRLAWQPHPDWTVSGAYLGTRLTDVGRTDSLGLGDLRFTDDDDHLAYLRARYRGTGPLREAVATLSTQRLDEGVDRYSCARLADGTVADLEACLRQERATLSRIRRYDDGVSALGGSLDSVWVPGTERVRLLLGLEGYGNWVDSSALSARASDGFVFAPEARGTFSDGSRYWTLGAYLYGEGTVVDLGPRAGELRVHGGVRYSQFAAEAEDVPGVGEVSYDRGGVVGSAGVQWLRPGRATAYFTFAQGFRAPNLQETTVLGDTGSRFEIPAPELAPERSDTLELGGRWWWGGFALEASYWYSFLRDAISPEAALWQGEAEVEGKPVTQLANGERGVMQGAELALRFEWQRLWAEAGASWTQGDIRTSDGWRPMRRIPPLFGRAALGVRRSDRKLSAEVFVRFALDQDRLHPSDREDMRICETAPYSGVLQTDCSGTPGWVTLGAHASWRLLDNLRLDLVLSNLTDARYRVHASGFDAPGLDARLGLAFSF